MPRRPALMLAYDHAVQRALLAAREAIDMVVVPGTIAALHQHGTSCFLKRLDNPYLIDPRTPVFQFMLSEVGPRPSTLALATAHGEGFAEQVAGPGPIWGLSDEDWLQAAANVARFQRDFGQACPPGRAPATIVPAYLMIEPPMGRAWDLSLAMIRETRAVVGDLPVTPVAALASRAPHDPDLATLDKMLADLSELRWLRSASIWLDDFDEYRAAAETVARLARLLSSWRHLALMALHGGYLSLLLHHFGLSGVSSGVTYGQQRSVLRAPTNPDISPRYYLPLLHAPVRPQEAEEFIRLAGPRARCTCDVCLEWADGDAVARLTPQQLRLHFVLARDAERGRVASRSLRALIEELRDAQELVKVAVDRAGAGSTMRDVPHHHLGVWAQGLELADA